MEWYKSESTVRPDEVDITSSKSTVYLRRNIKETYRTDEILDEEIIYYEYEETKITKEEYAEYLKGLAVIDIEQQRADIDYLAIMTGIEM